MNITVNPDLTSHIVNDDKTLECFLPSFNPETQVPFVSDAEVREFISTSLTSHYFQPYRTPEEREAQAQAALQSTIINATQQRLDAFARERHYDGILSACTYATSEVPRFREEGQRCVNARDETWLKLYQLLGEVQAGTRAMPTGYADVEPELPVLEWPAS